MSNYADAVKADQAANRNYIDLEVAFYLANGASTPDLMEAQFEFLVARGVTRSSELYDMWSTFLGGLLSPITGNTLEDLKKQWWEAGTPLS